MEIKTVYAVYFSATGRTRKVVTTLANAIAQTLELPLETVDFTLPAAREETYAFTDKDLVIFGTPTYAGKVPNKLLPFVQTGFAGNGALAVPVVTFGNRSFDNSLAELCASLENAGFHTIAAGAFACQHAFSDTLAAGRPDREDMTVLAQLGAAVVTKLGKMTEIPAPVAVDGDADAPYYRPLGLDGEPKNFLKAKPQTDRSKCTGCGVCAALCPMGSISREDPAEVTGVCIKCHACVRNCPTGAKYFDDEAFLSHKAMLCGQGTPFLHRKLANTEAPTTVSSPATTMDRPLIAPSTSPISMAFAVPSACAAEPMATPLAIGSVMRNTRQTATAMTLPRMPVMMIMATVSVT